MHRVISQRPSRDIRGRIGGPSDRALPYQSLTTSRIYYSGASGNSGSPANPNRADPPPGAPAPTPESRRAPADNCLDALHDPVTCCPASFDAIVRRLRARVDREPRRQASSA